MSSARPRELSPTCNEVWFIQTDACFEPTETGHLAGIGAVLYSPSGSRVNFFSQRLPDEVLADLNPSKKKTAIYECEFFALFCAFLLWGSRVSSTVVIYTDNNAVRDILISCATSSPVARQILVATLALECECQMTPWYNRVPTDSNGADAPVALGLR